MAGFEAAIRRGTSPCHRGTNSARQGSARGRRGNWGARQRARRAECERRHAKSCVRKSSQRKLGAVRQAPIRRWSRFAKRQIHVRIRLHSASCGAVHTSGAGFAERRLSLGDYAILKPDRCLSVCNSWRSPRPSASPNRHRSGGLDAARGSPLLLALGSVGREDPGSWSRPLCIRPKSWCSQRWRKST